MPAAPFTIRRLDATEAASYRELRLEALTRHPECFGASAAEEAARPLDWFAERLAGGTILGGAREEMLLGIIGLFVPETAKSRHKGLLWGLYVRPAARGTGLAAALVQRMIAEAATQVEELQLSVVSSNRAAVALYDRAGFREYGVEPRALKVAGRYYDELLMTLPMARG
ncbi:MAG: GNAT family N-acetyltransferase [Acetobacteraceae bacterium]